MNKVTDRPGVGADSSKVPGFHADTWEKKAVLFVGVVFFVVLGVSTVFRAGPHYFGSTEWGSMVHRTDFTVYRAAGQSVLDGTNIYDAHNRRGWYYMYPPVFSLTMVPFALLNPFWSSLLWYLLCALMLWHAVYLSARLVRELWPERHLDGFWLCSLIVILVLWPAMSGLARGQASLLVAYLVTMSVVLYLRGRQWLAGLCLAGSIVVKVFPGLLLVYFLVRRKFAMAAITMLCLLMLMLVVPSVVFGGRGNLALLRQWVTTIVLPANVPEGAEKNLRYSQMIDPEITRNQSVQAVMIRVFNGRGRTQEVGARENLARRVALVINAILVLVSVWFAWKGTTYSGRERELMECSVVILLMLFLAPVSWSHNYTQIVAPLAVIVGFSSGNRLSREACICRTGLVVFFLLSTLSVFVKPLEAMGGLLWGTLVLWASLVWCLARRVPDNLAVASADSH